MESRLIVRLYACAMTMAVGLASATSPIALADSEARQTVSSLAASFARSNEGDRGQFLADAANLIDYETMAQAALRPVQWSTMTGSQQRSYVDSFRKLVEKRYYKRWHKVFRRSKLEFSGESRSGPDTLVQTYVTKSGGESESVIWRLRKNMVVSLSVDGEDLLDRLRQRFQKQYATKGAQGLIARLQKDID